MFVGALGTIHDRPSPRKTINIPICTSIQVHNLMIPSHTYIRPSRVWPSVGRVSQTEQIDDTGDTLTERIIAPSFHLLYDIIVLLSEAVSYCLQSAGGGPPRNFPTIKLFFF